MRLTGFAVPSSITWIDNGGDGDGEVYRTTIAAGVNVLQVCDARPSVRAANGDYAVYTKVSSEVAPGEWTQVGTTLYVAPLGSYNLASDGTQIRVALDGQWVGLYMDGPVNTDSDGTYLITGLPPGIYDVQFEEGNCGNTDPYSFEQYETNGGTASITVSGEHITTDVDAALTAYSVISGTVTDSGSDAPLGGICVDIVGQNYYTGSGAYQTTNSDGTYSFTAIRTDSYTISFQSPRPVGDGSYSCGTAGTQGTYPPQGATTFTPTPEATQTVNGSLTAS